MQEGTIVGLTDKGFGFIRREGQEKDLFPHERASERTVRRATPGGQSDV